MHRLATCFKLLLKNCISEWAGVGRYFAVHVWLQVRLYMYVGVGSWGQDLMSHHNLFTACASVSGRIPGASDTDIISFLFAPGDQYYSLYIYFLRM